MERNPCVYILASKPRGTLYIGVTSNLAKRVWQHKNNAVGGFTRKYSVHHLVWYEQHPSMATAIQREKAVKEWQRLWKMRLIERTNRDWHDLYESIL